MNLLTRQRLAVSAVFFQSGLCFSSWASRIPHIKETFELSEYELGLLLLIKPVGSLVGLPLAGWIVDTFGSRKAVILSSIFYSLSLFLVGLSPSVTVLALVLLVFGISGNLFNISNNTQALLLQNQYGKVIMASFHGLWSLGGFCGAGIGMLMLQFDVPIEIHLAGIMVVVLLLLAFSYQLLIRENTSKSSGKFAFKKPDPTLLKLGIISFCGMMCEGCMFDWSGVYFKEVVLAKEGLIIAGYIAFMSTMALGRFIADSFINKFGTKTILQINGVLIFIGLSISVLFPYLIPATIGFLFVGIGTSSVIPLAYSETGKTTTVSPGIALAMVSTIGYFGFLLGPPIIGFVAGAAGYRFSFGLIALVGLTITIMVAFSSIRNARKQLTVNSDQ